MPIHRTRKVWGIKRKFSGGKMRPLYHPKKLTASRLFDPVYWGEKTSLSGPITGGGNNRPVHNIMGRLTKAMSGFGIHHGHKSHHGRRGHSMRGGCISTL